MLEITSLVRLYVPTLITEWVKVLKTTKPLNEIGVKLLFDKDTNVDLMRERIGVVTDQCLDFLPLLEAEKAKL